MFFLATGLYKEEQKFRRYADRPNQAEYLKFFFPKNGQIKLILLFLHKILIIVASEMLFISRRNKMRSEEVLLTSVYYFTGSSVDCNYLK